MIEMREWLKPLFVFISFRFRAQLIAKLGFILFISLHAVACRPLLCGVSACSNSLFYLFQFGCRIRLVTCKKCKRFPNLPFSVIASTSFHLHKRWIYQTPSCFLSFTLWSQCFEYTCLVHIDNPFFPLGPYLGLVCLVIANCIPIPIPSLNFNYLFSSLFDIYPSFYFLFVCLYRLLF
jgi:hypothetical protein